MQREFIYSKPFDNNWRELGLSEDDLRELEFQIMLNP